MIKTVKIYSLRTLFLCFVIENIFQFRYNTTGGTLMIFTLAMILNELGDLDPVCNQKSQKNQEIQGVFRYSERQQIFHKNSIFDTS